MPCASILKPVFAVLTPEADEGDKRAACADSDNLATDRIVAAAGGVSGMTSRIRHATGVELRPGVTWGKYLVRPTEVVAMYSSLVRSHGMETFCDLLAQPRREPTVASVAGTKLGWDVGLGARPHVRVAYLHEVRIVAPDAVGSRGRIDVAMSATQISLEEARQWEDTLDVEGPYGALSLHLQWARLAVSCALAELCDQAQDRA